MQINHSKNKLLDLGKFYLISFFLSQITQLLENIRIVLSEISKVIQNIQIFI